MAHHWGAADAVATAEGVLSDARLEAAQAAREAAKATAAVDKNPADGHRYAAAIEAHRVASEAASAAFAAAQKVAEEAAKEAVRRAGDSPVDRATAKAKAISAHAVALGEAEVAAEEASLTYARVVVETAKVCKIAEHRIKSAQAHAAAAAEAAKNDPHAIGNPYYRQAPTLLSWQFDALPDAVRLQAIKDGATIVADDPPPFTAYEARSVLRTRGLDRQVLTRAEFSALPPAEQPHAAKWSILIDD
ncbi:hypothetical protein [Paludisphaera mucosa]|uniref:Uncharacterized protein n=1 Tax=Paludisphaera mucosa TaxID=3030827 RepID=A0ABT6FMC0_9BACT|nr:hypothetical protein [Paludisphaera mucosa]MDG3008530.1 hypothetical protein [Paludisphaera mucosa]